MSASPSKGAAFQKQLSFLSPAKINLFFRVLKKREDGFHEIASLYQALDLFDTLHIGLSKEDVFSGSDPSLAMDESNLVSKAVALFRKETGLDHPLSIHLEKRIPMQAGLGGGSSNAATTLFALNELFSTHLSSKKLEELGAHLGSDVPFFFSTGTAYCFGRGEKLKEMPLPDSMSSSSLWIVKPEGGLSTPLVYRACKPLSLLPRDPKMSLDSFYEGNTPSFYNDLEEAAFSLAPELEEIKKSLLRAGFEKVVLCGSGTAFFCIGDGQPSKIEGLKCFQVKPIQRESARWYAI